LIRENCLELFKMLFWLEGGDISAWSKGNMEMRGIWIGNFLADIFWEERRWCLYVYKIKI